MSLTSRSVKRPIATLMAYLIVITLGIIGFRFLPVDLLPPIEYPQLTVWVNYDNVGPEEMEIIVTERVENAIAGVPNVERVDSRSSEGNTRVTLNFSRGTNLEEATNDVRGALDRLRRSLPDEVDGPGIWKFDPNDSPIVVIGVRSERDLAELTQIIERDLSQRFEQIPGAGAIDVWGGVNQEVRVEIMRDRLISSNLTPNDVVQALNRENTTTPGGNVREGLSDLYVRNLGEFTTVDDIANTVIRTINGSPIRVKDIAKVEMTYQDIGRYVEIDNMPTVRFGIRKQTGANTVAVAADIHREVERVNAERSDVQLRVITDQSIFINESINNVKNAAIWGGILAVIVLFAFLRNGSSTLIIAISIPISIIATFGLLYFNGLTLNQMSFGGLALGVGLIVDNAIVVLENIVRKRQRGEKRDEAAVHGTKEVAGAIVASTLTTSVIFLPVLFMQTVTGALFQELALVVVFALLCSLLVALTLVPMMSSKILTIKEDNPDPEKRPRWQRFFEKVENKYGQLLSRALNAKKWVALSAAAALLAALWFAPSIPFELAPETDADEIQIRINMDGGTNIAVMYEYLMELDDIVNRIIPKDEVQYITRDVRNGSARIDLTLYSPDQRKTPSNILADQIRDQLQGAIPGMEVRVWARSGLWIMRRIFSSGGDGEAVQLQLRGYDLEMAEQISEEISNRIERINGVNDVNTSRREGRPEQNVFFDRERIAKLGISVSDVAGAIQTSIGGTRAGMFRVSGDEYPISVRFRPEDRMSTLDLDNISVRSADGEVVPISSLVTQDRGRGPTTIQRVDGQRVTYITANLESGYALGDAVNTIRADLSEMPLPDGFSIFYGGEYEEQQKAQRDFTMAIIMALILIYMVMAAQFERFIDPLIVMFSVPVAIVGVIPIMLLTNTTFNIQSLMGVVMLIGIVVNNAIVLVDYINLMRREHNLGVVEAVVEAGKLRLRPILMTTLTTVLGLLPLSFGIGTGGEIQASLARVVIGGLTASTLITLLLIPVIYVSVNSGLEWVRAKVPALAPKNSSEPAPAIES